jgi:purine-binding chemotaxis protein CheW
MSSDRRPVVSGAGEPAVAAPSPTDSLLAFADSILARAPAPAPVVEMQSFLTFSLCGEEFGLPLLRSREIVRVGEITRIPEAPPHVRGVLNLRGRVLPVVELRTRLGMPAAPLTARSRVIVVEALGRLFGLLVDRVSRIVKIADDSIQPAPREALFGNPDDVTGIAPMGDESIILLDVDKILLLDAPASPATDAISEPTA